MEVEELLPAVAKSPDMRVVFHENNGNQGKCPVFV
jgi:hypothetical protein